MASAPALLLLPPPPSASFELFRAAYEPILSAVLERLAEALHESSSPIVVDIALTVPGLLSPACQPRSKVFPSLQRLFTNIYRLIGIVCVEKNIELDGPGGVDPRAIMVDYDSFLHSHPGVLSHMGPIIDMQTLAKSGRPWNCIFYPENSVGQQLATAFSSLHSQAQTSSAGNLHPIPNMAKWASSTQLLVSEKSDNVVAHYSVIVGGTFDHFHIGHKLLLTATALALEPVTDAETSKERLLTVGVTGDELLVNKKYAEVLESYDERSRNTGAFLTSIMDFAPTGNNAPVLEHVSRPETNGQYVLMKVRPGLTLKLVKISDPFGPTITEENISALIVSAETRSGGAAVNQEREKKGWRGLDVFEIDVLHSEDIPTDDVENFASKISSTDIRRRRVEGPRHS